MSKGGSECVVGDGGEGGGLEGRRRVGYFDEVGAGGDEGGDGDGSGDARRGVRELPETGRERGDISVSRRDVGFGSSPVCLCDWDRDGGPEPEAEYALNACDREREAAK